jgi:OmpA-OmpF porin, OOP family
LKAQQYHLEQVIRIAPNSARYKNAFYSLGKVYFNQGKYEAAGELLAKLQSFGIDNERMLKDVNDLQEISILPKWSISKSRLILILSPMPGVLNSFPLQYFPVLTADEQTIIYTSRDGVSFHDDENIVLVL